MFLSPLGLRGKIAWIQKEELKLEEKASQWEPWSLVQGPGQTTETKNISRGMDTPASFSFLPLFPGSASHGGTNQVWGHCPWGASGHSAGWRRVEGQRRGVSGNHPKLSWGSSVVMNKEWRRLASLTSLAYGGRNPESGQESTPLKKTIYN